MKHEISIKKYICQNPNTIGAVFYYGLLLAAMLFLVFLQPLGEPPDESGRYLIVQYICLHGKLPHGADPEILIYGYGGSYGFQPILTYIIQGYLLRFLFQFCRDGYLLLLAARLVNVVFGMIMAVYVRKTAKLLFATRSGQWLFSVLVMFLPQSLFLHTYVNTDSMAMMSTAMMLYAWLTGYRTRWDRRSCITLAIGISLCALSYYNAYGFVLCSMLFFAYTFLEQDAETGKYRFAWNSFLRRGLFISAIVLLCVSWWFIRNAVLYDGDFLGLAARQACAMETATEQYHPLTKETYYNTGYSLFYMVFQTDFLELLSNSTIATFGPMSIVTFKHIYTVVKWLTLIGLAGMVVPKRLIAAATETGADRSTELSKTESVDLQAQTELVALQAQAPSSRPLTPEQFPAPDRRAFYGLSLLCIIIPVVLCVGYSYLSDYQPQGRYILPMLLPFVYFMALGLQKLAGLFSRLLRLPKQRAQQALTGLVTLFYLYALWITLLRVVFPIYYPSSILYYIRNVL